MKKKCRDSMIGDKNPMYGKSWKDFSTDEKIKNHRINISNSLKRRYKDKKNRDLTAAASKKCGSQIISKRNTIKIILKKFICMIKI